jgi:hypothetical protein
MQELSLESIHYNIMELFGRALWFSFYKCNQEWQLAML